MERKWTIKVEKRELQKLLEKIRKKPKNAEIIPLVEDDGFSLSKRAPKGYII